MKRSASHTRTRWRWLWLCLVLAFAQPARAQECTLLPGPFGPATTVSLGPDGSMLTAMVTSDVGPLFYPWRRDAQQNWRETGLGYFDLSPVMAAESDAGVVLVGSIGEGHPLSGLFWWDGISESWTWGKYFWDKQVLDALLIDGRVLVGTTDGLHRYSLTYPVQADSSLDGLRVSTLSRVSGGVVAATDTGVYTSPDDGVSWTFVLQPPEAVVSMVGTSDGGLLAATTNGTLTIYAPGGSWVTTDLEGYHVTHLARTSGGVIVAAARSSTGIGGYVFESINDGSTWSDGTLVGTHITSIDAMETDVAAATPAGVVVRSGPGQWTVTGGLYSAPYNILATDRVLAVINAGSVSLSEDEGTSWARMAIAESVWVLGHGANGSLLTVGEHAWYRISPESHRVTRFDLPGALSDPTGILETAAGILIATANDGAFISTDGGVSFDNVLSGRRIDAVLHAPDGSIYVGGDRVDRSDDGGLTWQSAAPGPGNFGGEIQLVALADGRLFAATWDRVYALSEDGTWIQLLSPGDGVRAIVAGPGNTLYVGTGNGNVLGSADAGRSWSDVGCPREDRKEVTSLALAPGGGLFVGHLLGGLEFMAPPSGVHVQDAPDADVSFDVYPNPASSRVSVRGSGNATVTMYDMTGRSMKSWKLDGGSTTTLELGTLPPGTYFLRLVDGQGSHTRALSVL